HLELSGVHSGDSTSIYPPQSFSEEQLDELRSITEKVCTGMNAIGIVNIQFIYCHESFYIIEVNPRASRTVPFLSKVTGVPMIDLSTKAMLGVKLSEIEVERLKHDYVSLKVPVFSMENLSGAEMMLSPEMKSTGELLSIDKTLDAALYKAQIALGYKLEFEHLFVSVSEQAKKRMSGLIEILKVMPCQIYATRGTHNILSEHGIKSEVIEKLNESELILEKIKSHDIDIVINIPSKGFDAKRDGFRIRRQAIDARVQCLTSIESATRYFNALMKEHDDEIYDICHLS
ncbi:MAG: ATP-grasp domain-containing protein, partial [Desulfobacterales bacterium]|nr:ATP-grasp domain-containing protein [Desulfobacterales bacterium]